MGVLNHKLINYVALIRYQVISTTTVTRISLRRNNTTMMIIEMLMEAMTRVVWLSLMLRRRLRSQTRTTT